MESRNVDNIFNISSGTRISPIERKRDVTSFHSKKRMKTVDTTQRKPKIVTKTIPKTANGSVNKQKYFVKSKNEGNIVKVLERYGLFSKTKPKPNSFYANKKDSTTQSASTSTKKDYSTQKADNKVRINLYS